MGRLFGTDGVRGLAGTELTEDLARRLGRAAVLVLGMPGVAPSFVVARDTRGSGPGLQDALAGGILEAGGDVVLAGVEPTPAVAYLTVASRATAGIVISASHNPPEYNGIKFFSSAGMKLPDAVEDRIEDALGRSLPGEVPGRTLDAGDEREQYLEHLVSAAEARLNGLRVVVDCANGSASEDAPEVLRRLGAEVHPIHARPDGTNINVGCGALHPEVVAAEVVRLGADAGVSHDGDADRALFSDAAGNVVDGDQVLAACAASMAEQGRLAGNAVVTTVMANLGLHRAMQERGIEVVTTRVGDRYVLEEMLRTGATLGGEQSGHVIYREHATTGDGLLTAVRVLSLAAKEGRTIQELASTMRRFPQVIRNVRVQDRAALDAAAAVWDAVRAAEADLKDRGRVLVRASGTEHLVRVMVEAEEASDATRHADAIADVVQRALG